VLRWRRSSPRVFTLNFETPFADGNERIWARKQLGSDLLLGEPLTRNPGFLGGESVEDSILAAGVTAGTRQKFGLGSLRECVSAKSVEHLTDDAQLLACVDRSTFPTKPLAEKKMATGD
jgi:hypothetical protein